MKTVVLDGTTYTKVSALAKQYGYTTDYLGQLCRSSKIQAELVGRAWYAVEESLQAHKAGRYQASSTADNSISVTRDDHNFTAKIPIHVEPRLTKKTGRSVHDAPAASRYTNNPPTVQYLSDQAELSPAPNKHVTASVEPGQVTVSTDSSPGRAYSIPITTTATTDPVETDTSTSLKITKKSQPYDLSFTDLPVVSLRGKVTIKDLENEDYIAATSITKPARRVQPRLPHQARIPVTSQAHHTASKTPSVEPVINRSMLSTSSGAASRTMPSLHKGFAPTSVQAHTQNVPVSNTSYYLVTFTMVAAVLLGVVVIAGESSYLVEDGSVTTTWHLQLASLGNLWTTVWPW